MTRAARKMPPALPQVTEAEVMAGVEDALRVMGCHEVKRRNTGGAHHQNADGSTRYVAFGEAGDSDWAGPLPDGRHLALEVKRPGKRPTPEQMEHLMRVNASGGVGFWVDDSRVALAVLQKVLAGWKVVIDDDGRQWVDDGKD